MSANLRSGTLGLAAYGVVYLAPIAVAVSFNLAYVYWLVSGVAIVALVAWLWSLDIWQRLTALVVNAGTSFANLLLASSLYVQGVGFNAQFFYHLDGGTFAIARQAYATLFFGAWIYWLILCVFPSFLGWRRQPRMGKRRSGLAIAGAAVVGIVANAPLLSFLSFALLLADEQPPVVAARAHDAVEIEPASLQDPKNLVLIFAESLEATYSRADLFGDDFTPRLTALANRGASFDDIREVNNTGSTITGMVAALCALPLRSPMPWEHVNTVLPNVDVSLPGEACLGDILAAHGYRTVFLGGAPLGFAGKGKFLAAHGFQERYGAAHFIPLLDDPDYRSGWGIHDDTLFDFAMRKLDELAVDDRPFAMTMLTLDTHHPAGLPSRGCPPREGEGSAMEHAIRCSDDFLGEFIEDIRARYGNTVVALFSDHLAHRNELFTTLRGNANARRLRFTVWGTAIEPIRVEKRGTHYDVMPTLLDFLGFEDWLRHNWGASLLRHDSPWFALDDRPKASITQGLPTIQLDTESSIVFEAKGPTITIGERRIVATNEGLPLIDAAFSMEFDERGEIIGFLDSQDFDVFLSGLSGKISVGVSTNDLFNARYVSGEPAKLVYFAGCLESGDYVAGPLWWREQVDVAAVLDGCTLEKP